MQAVSMKALTIIANPDGPATGFAEIPAIEDPLVTFGDGPCPRCGADVDYEFDCPGFYSEHRGESIIKVCHPVCANTIVYSCLAQCGWWYSALWRRGDHWLWGAMGERPTWLK